MEKGWSDMNLYQKVKMGFQLVVNAFSSGSRTFVDSDPVWCVFLAYSFFFPFGLGDLMELLLLGGGMPLVSDFSSWYGFYFT